MEHYVQSILISILITIGISTYIKHKLIPHWNKREYAVLENQWTTYLTWGTIIAAASALTLYHTTQSLIMSTVISTLIYYLTIAAQTDLALHLVPNGLTLISIITGIFMGTTALALGEHTIAPVIPENAHQESITSLLLYTGIILTLCILWLFVEIIGLGDLKTFLATGFYISWYLGHTNMLLVYIITNMLLFVNLIINNISKANYLNKHPKEKKQAKIDKQAYKKMTFKEKKNHRENDKSRNNHYIAVIPAFAVAVIFSSVFLTSQA
jgi:Flp pilus assembly protein protease CpaA